ncbi:MAG TPA: ATPase, partial [Micromonospora sp.]
AVAPAHPTLPAPPAVGLPAHPTLPAPPAVGLPAGPVAGAGVQPKTERAELPIYREMEATWFRAHGQDATQIFTMPPLDQAPPVNPLGKRGGTQPSARLIDAVPAPEAEPAPTRPPLATRTPGMSAPPPVGSVPTAGSSPTVVPDPPQEAEPVVPSTPPVSGSEGWRTAADEGWALANRAAEPATAGTTRSGLPKRVPQAQLVPGGVTENTGTQRAKRTPDEVRGLLSAYHRGVQRGRTAGIEENSTGSTKETSE